MLLFFFFLADIYNIRLRQHKCIFNETNIGYALQPE